jgi:DnaK suppressor protein
MDRTDPAPTLEAAYARAATRVQELAGALDAIIEASASANLDDEHDPEGSTVGFERAQVAALLQQQTARLAELEAARERVRTGEYGNCTGCGVPIARERLEAQPATRMCVACARNTAGRTAS